MANLFTRYRRSIETSDRQSDDSLKTHYYKTRASQMLDTVEKMFKEDADCQIKTVSKDHGEIAVELKKPFPCFLIATVIQSKPLETAVDFHISTERISLTGAFPALKKRINAYYDRMAKLHTEIKPNKN
ncbi:hypothetical protein [Neobacillus dielmonensis]|uniref:hypothetical protein n=1 Tax=Neobacillus dielmonensis TaxID=1347369 RepID=UPI0006937694|nr:hypothetical protein [Neobacillus dielmonensis]